MFTIAYTRDGVPRAECPGCLMTLRSRFGYFRCPATDRPRCATQARFTVQDIRGGQGVVVWESQRD